MGKWTFNDPNPIVGYTVGIELAQPLSPSVVRHISLLHSRFRRDLPRRLNLQAVTFQMGAPAPQSPQPAMSGVVFDSLLPDGRTKSALTANQNVVSFMIADYSRWVEFWPLADRLLREICIPALNETPAKSLLLIANNRFRWANGGSESDVNVSQLLRREQRYIAPYILDYRGPCHCFMGYQADNREPPGRRTDNVFLTVTTSEDGTFLDLNFNLRLELTIPASLEELFESTDVDGRSQLEQILDSLHQLNKRLMRNIIADSMVEAIPGLSP